MSTKFRLLVVTAFAAIIGLGFAGSALAQVGDLPGMDAAGIGGLEAPAVGELGNTQHGPCVRDLLDLPAVGACEDAQGRVIMDLPALKLVGPPAPARAPRRLPETGVNVGDLAAMGGAALAAGAALTRRVRMALAS